jgi:hypothetical protein
VVVLTGSPGFFSRFIVVPPLGAVYRDGGEDPFGGTRKI